jgi:peptidoglycan/LPS O-acetylase OafA/YrhL
MASSQASTSESYRPDIDGLRAIAVLSVILFHIDKRILPGGFVGVDIFFVISGFLITRNIAHELAAGRFSIVEFYRRRVKRIAPAMLLVVAATVTAAQWLMLPEDATSTAKSAVWSLASMANVFFWRYQDMSYFATDSADVPLLHLWSLGVEEQFYIIWPPLLMLCYRRWRVRTVIVVALAGAAGSFLLAQLYFRRDPSFVYYMLPTRAGELLLGAIVAVAVLNAVENKVPRALIMPLAVCGASLLAGTLLLLTENHPFPGWLAIPPTAGTALLILAGHCGDNRIARLLGTRPMVWVGVASYSAYLWHWPLLALYHYGYGGITPVVGVTILVLTLLLARLSYRYVEQPARRTKAPALQVFLRQYIVPAGAIAMFALVAIYGDRLGVHLRSQSYRTQLQHIRGESRPAFLYDYVCQRQRVVEADTRNERCVLGADGSATPRALLWGDSNAAHYIQMISVFGQHAGFRFRNIEIGTCPPLIIDPAAFVNPKRLADCRSSLERVRPLIEQFPVVILSAHYTMYQENSEQFLPAFFDTASRLAGEGKLVIVIGKAPPVSGYDRLCREKRLSYPLLRCPNVTVAADRDILAVNARLRHFAEGTANIRYFDATDRLCPGGLCSSLDPDGVPRYFDAGHLTLQTSSAVGTEIVNSTGVPAPFALISSWQTGLTAR